MPPIYHCYLAGSGIARCVFICPLLHCLLTSPHVSHCNSMQHLCALAWCTCQVHQGNMWLFLGVWPWSSSRQSSYFRCIVMFLSLLLCHWLCFLLFFHFLTDIKGTSWTKANASNSFCTHRPVIVKLARDSFFSFLFFSFYFYWSSVFFFFFLFCFLFSVFCFLFSVFCFLFCLLFSFYFLLLLSVFFFTLLFLYSFGVS
jgi:hypothetical protein